MVDNLAPDWTCFVLKQPSIEVKKMNIHIVSLKLTGILLAALFAGTVLAKGAELKFESLVISVGQATANEGSLTVTIYDVEVPVIVNGDTEIEEGGEEVGLGDISAGDFVKINAFFADEGLIADEVKILDERAEQFRLRGLITAVDPLTDTNIITLLGVDVTVDGNTAITRRGTDAATAPGDLIVGDEVNVRGGLSDGVLLAFRVHVGVREQGNIELEGEITAVSDTAVTLNLEGGTSLSIVIDGDTSVVGALVVGGFAEVEGRLLPDLSLLAFEIAVDEDGDGDADDDNRRGSRGDEHSNNGRNDDEDSDGSSTSIETGSEIILVSDATDLSGKVEFSYESEGDGVEQELEIELEHAPAGAVYDVVVFFGDTAVEFGSGTANDEGEFELEFKAGDDTPDDDDRDLGPLLPDGKDVRDITGIQILQNGDVILEGDF
jgi:hypothetical protein